MANLRSQRRSHLICTIRNKTNRILRPLVHVLIVFSRVQGQRGDFVMHQSGRSPAHNNAGEALLLWVNRVPLGAPKAHLMSSEFSGKEWGRRRLPASCEFYDSASKLGSGSCDYPLSQSSAQLSPRGSGSLA